MSMLDDKDKMGSFQMSIDNLSKSVSLSSIQNNNEGSQSLRESEKIENPYHFYRQRKVTDLEIGFKIVEYARPLNIKTKFKPSTALKFR